MGVEKTDIKLVFAFEELNAWKKARELKIEINELSKSFPVEERYRLTNQIVRSSRSVCALIAEGHGRFTYADQIHFCIEARGSLIETMNHLIDAFDCNYIAEIKLTTFRIKIKEVERLLNGYLDYLRKKKDEPKPKTAK